MNHAVFNQAPVLQDYNPFLLDRALKEGVAREGAGWAEPTLTAFGERVGSEEVIRWGVEANENPPKLSTHDRHGNRADSVDYHPAYHHLMTLAVQYGLHGAPWKDPRRGAHVARAALFFVDAQNELGHGCPISMTYSVVPALRREAEVAEVWEPRVTSRIYDGRLVPASEKGGALMGMAMTEKQGGSDVRANTTSASDAGDGTWRLNGHKWFCSAPMCDAFLALAQTPKGLTCFLLPRFLPDGSRNNLFFQRLKNKLGNKSNASSEVEYVDAVGWRVGEEGRGVPTILDMATHTRLDCVIGSSGLMRAALTQAVHHCQHRSAFGRPLLAQPLMREVLADLSVESEAATTLMLRLARAYDESDPAAVAFRRLATPIAKYYVCKRSVGMISEAAECLGGAGYVEDFPFARMHRESPLYSIWEGSGNVMALDVLRALRKSPDAVEVFLGELRAGSGVDERLDRAIGSFEASLREESGDERAARRLVEAAARTLQGALLVQHAPAAVADAFCGCRLGQGSGTYGTLPREADVDGILAAVLPG